MKRLGSLATFFQSKDEWSHHRTLTQSKAVIDLDKYGKDESAKRIKNALSRKGDFKTIQNALSNFCFSIIIVAFPEHPILQDEQKIDLDAFEDIDTLFITLNETVETSNPDFNWSTTANDSRYTEDPDFYISMQHPNFVANIKTEPTDDTFDTRKTSTPAVSDHTSDQSTSSDGTNSIDGSFTTAPCGITTRSYTQRNLSESPFDQIKLETSI